MNMFLPFDHYVMIALFWRNGLRMQTAYLENCNDAFLSWGKMMGGEWNATKDFLLPVPTSHVKPERNVTLAHAGNVTTINYGARFAIPSYYPTHTASVHQLHTNMRFKK